jgi:hypothetical protein
MHLQSLAYGIFKICMNEGMRRNKYFQGNLQIVQIYVISYVR